MDIFSTNKGLLIPRVSLQSASDPNTNSLPAVGLLVYNVNSLLTRGTGFYFNNGVPAAPNWVKINELNFPFYRALTTNDNIFNIENYSNSPTSSALKGYSLAGTGVYASSTYGYAIQSVGKVKITGSSQCAGMGKALTSDSTGNATWQGAVAFSEQHIVAGHLTIPPNTNFAVTFNSESYDLQDDAVNGANGTTFTAPVDGIYHFDVQVVVNPRNNQPAFEYDLQLFRKRGKQNGSIAAQRIQAPTAGIPNLFINTDVRLEAGDVITVVLFQDSPDNQFINSTISQTNRFTGHLVVKL